MWGEFANSEGADDGAVGVGENRNGDGAGDASLASVRLGDSAKILLEVAEFDGFPAFCCGTGDTLAEWDKIHFI